ncbi:hypothetical protein C8F04DRAFT_1393825 [Mycena alexandri]|uniref:Alpha-amylase n=1 Tax=Mycena alexandri TaxID=1745969 RepID=A0AAD6T4A6_9AGAR|nr:hypothetical protein C8F04DRAFT_1393825 [Mycena alexandri]
MVLTMISSLFLALLLAAFPRFSMAAPQGINSPVGREAPAGTKVVIIQMFEWTYLGTDTDYVEGVLADYANRLLSLGVDGFRLDAAKHMAATDIANILSRLIRKEHIPQRRRTLNRPSYFPTPSSICANPALPGGADGAESTCAHRGKDGGADRSLVQEGIEAREGKQNAERPLLAAHSRVYHPPLGAVPPHPPRPTYASSPPTETAICE